MSNYHQFSFPTLKNNDKVTIKVIETDDIVDPFLDPSSPTPESPTQQPTIDLTPQQTLHEFNFVYHSTNQTNEKCPIFSEIDHDTINVLLKLNGEYDIHVTIDSETLGTDCCSNYLIHFENNEFQTPFQINLPSQSYVPPVLPTSQPPRLNRSSTSQSQPPQQTLFQETPTTSIAVQPTNTTTQPTQPQQPPPSSTASSSTTTSTTKSPPPASTSTSGDSGLIHGKPATWWNKKNWEEIDDPTLGLFYKNKVTGETTLYYDDFDLDSQ